MDRRAFLRSAALVAAGVVAADQMELADRIRWTRRLFSGFGTIPTLYGDGIHDDAPALNALFAGKRIRDPRRLVTVYQDGVHLTRGSFRVSDPIRVASHSHITGCDFTAAPSLRGPILDFSQSRHSSLSFCRITGNTQSIGLRGAA